MKKSTVLALLLGVLFISAPFVRSEDSYEDDDEEPAPVRALLLRFWSMGH